MSQLDLIKQTLAGSKSGGDGPDIAWYKFPKSTDKVIVRPLPHWEGKGEFPLKLMIRHYSIPESDSSIKCPKTWGLQCAICDVLDEYEGRIDLKDWTQSFLCNFNLLVLKDSTQTGIDCRVPHVATGSKGFLQWFVDLWDEPANRTIIDVFQGRNITVEREKYNGKFKIMPAFEATPIAATQEEIGTVTSQLHNLDNVFKPPGDEDIDKIRKLAVSLKDAIENRILANGGNINQIIPGAPVQTAPGFGQPAAAPTTAPPLATAAPTTAPPVEAPAAPAIAPGFGQPAAPVAQPPLETAPPIAAPPVTAPPLAAPAAPVAQPYKAPATVAQPFQAPAQPAAPVAQPAAPAPAPPLAAPPVATMAAPLQPPAPAPTAAAPAPTIAPTAAAPATAAAPVAGNGQVKVEKPKGAPDCYADKAVYRADRGECLECQHEFHCSETIAGRM